ncbi:GRB10-interacting GYF protein 2 isoform X3 [Schistocerca gregaria]|uniref:GRB10-interacting GYF protein 2 isoform X3 n=1 Tax=Schistocerca gregaria TaxID=7010 RepID=UPI00211E7FAE|nr:GRB10-interacting GYF protein 2 isoform X3 [Schistocerca gregaria]
MADSLKFGPEWLRTLNQSLAASAAANNACTPPSSEGSSRGGGGHGPSTTTAGVGAGPTVPRPALTLARHRYGREEMLALFDPGLPPPPPSPAALAVLFVERAQPPLALVQMSDDETRVWNRGVNSDAVLRMSKSTGAGGPSGQPTSGPGGVGGRGGGLGVTGGPGGLRGQSRSLGIPGRGAGSGPGPGVLSGSAPFYRYDDSSAAGGDSGGDGIRGGSIGSLRPGRPFVRMQQSSERNWSDRNGTDHEWGGGSGPGSSALGTSPRKDFGRGFDSWRRQGRNTVNSEQDDDPPAPGGWRSSTTKWSAGRTGGSSWRSDSEPNKDAGGWSVPRSNSNSWGDDHISSRGPHPHVHRPWDPQPHAHTHPAAHGTDSDSVSGPLPEWATETPTESRGSFDASGAFHGGTPLSDDEFLLSQDGSGGHSTARGQRHSALSGDPGKRAGSPLTQRDTVPPGVSRSASQNGIGDPAERHIRPMQEVTKSASTGSDSPRSVTSRSKDRSGGTEDVESRRTATEKQTPPPPPAPSIAPSDRGRERERTSSRPDEEMERMREVADDLVAKLMEDEDHRTGVPPPTSVPPGSDKWYYRDPQGDVQGPFSSSEMLDWFRSGYFNLTLLVRRACDERYSSLGDIIKLWGRLPFTPGGPPVPPIKADAIPPVSSVSVPPLVPAAPPPTSDILSDSHGHNLLMQQYQYQYTMLQRQLLLGQQAAVHAAAQAAIGELSQSDRWATLSPIEQRRLVTERLALHQMLGVPPLVPPVSVPPPSIVDLFSVAAAQQQPGPQPAQQPPPPPPSAQPQPVSATNPVAQLISQMQMGAVAAAVAPKEHQPPPPHALVDPLQQLIQQMSGGLPSVSSAPSVPPPGGQPLGGGIGLDSDGPGRTLLQTLNAGKPPAMPPPRLPPVQVDSVWGGSVPAGYSLGVGTAAPWMNAAVTTPTPPVSSTSSVPPGQLPSLPMSLWDLAQQQGKDIKTEHQVLEEQLRAEEERRLEEQRKREENEEAMRKQKELLEKEEEEKRKLKEKEDEEKKKKKRQEEEEEKKKRKQLEEEDKKKKKQQEEEERRRKKQQEEEEKKRKKQQEEEERRKKKEEERRLREQEEEEKRRKKEQEEAERQLKEEEEREKKKRQQEAKKIEEAMKKEKEKAAQKREEEKKRKEAEKEKKKKAEEAKKKEEEEKKKQEEEERTRQRRQEQQEKALRKLQEQQEKARQAAALRPAPWTAAPAPPAATVQQPLTEIQRQERERERQLQLQQQQLQQQQQQQQLLQQQQQNANAAAQNSAGAQTGNGSSVLGGLQLRWAEVKPPVPAAKSLTEIQQEEQENLAKQLERERLQQQQQQQQAAAAPTVATASIWGSASQSLSWAASVSAASPWGNTGVNSNSTGSGFWEDAAKTSAAVPISKSRSATNHNNNIINNNSSGNNKNSGGNANTTQPWKNMPANTKTRSKKEEAVVMKLFEPRPDEFTQWCTDALGSLKHSIDVPTFVAFLRDIESAYEVKDYVRVYLGEGRDAQEFSRQFLERRSKLQQQKAARDRTPEDDLSTPAPAITPSQDFHEVKGKGKKAKKSRMYKVDSRILGFSVTAAQDRLNVGERDFGDGM